MEATLSAAATTPFSISKTLDFSSQTSRSQSPLLHSPRSTTTTNAVSRRSAIKLDSKSPLFGLRKAGAAVSPVWRNLDSVPSCAAGVDDASPLSSDVITLDVRGMTCGGCSASVQRILENQAQVASASVNLKTETAIVLPVSEAKATPNWQKVIGEDLAKHLTTCGFESTLREG